MEFNNRWRDLFLVMAFFGTWLSCLTGAISDAIPDALLLSAGFNVAITIGQATLRIVPDLI